jgi:hypothetical protein
MRDTGHTCREGGSVNKTASHTTRANERKTGRSPTRAVRACLIRVPGESSVRAPNVDFTVVLRMDYTVYQDKGT